MKKLLFFLSFAVLLFFFLLSKQSAFAFSCNINPNAINDQDKKIPMSILSDGNLSTGTNNKYDVYIYDSGHTNCPFITGNCHYHATSIPTDTDGNLSFTADFTSRGQSKGSDLTVSVYPTGNTSAKACDDMKVRVVDAVSSGFCAPINIMPSSPRPSDNLIITPKDIASGSDGSGSGPNDNHHLIIVDTKTGSTVREFGAGGSGCITGSELAQGFNISSYTTSDQVYQLYVKSCNPFGFAESEQCRATFSVNPGGGAVFTGSISGVFANAQPPPPCGNGGPEDAPTGNTCDSISSAVGPIPTDIKGFIKLFFSVILIISGAIALILLIISGYKLITSHGNPEKIQDAKEQLTAAVIGLAFVIFSLVALETIGVDIIGLPGFGSLISL